MNKKLMTGLSVASFLALAPFAHAADATDAGKTDTKAEAKADAAKDAEKHCAGEKDDKGAEKHCAPDTKQGEKACGAGSCGAMKKEAKEEKK